MTLRVCVAGGRLQAPRARPPVPRRGIRWGGASGNGCTTTTAPHGRAPAEMPRCFAWVQGLRPRCRQRRRVPFTAAVARRPVPYAAGCQRRRQRRDDHRPRRAERFMGRNRADVDPCVGDRAGRAGAVAAGRAPHAGQGRRDHGAGRHAGGHHHAAAAQRCARASPYLFRDEMPRGAAAGQAPTWTNLLAGYRVAVGSMLPERANGLVVAPASPRQRLQRRVCAGRSAAGVAGRRPSCAPSRARSCCCRTASCRAARRSPAPPGQPRRRDVATAYAEAARKGDLLPFATGELGHRRRHLQPRPFTCCCRWCARAACMFAWVRGMDKKRGTGKIAGSAWTICAGRPDNTRGRCMRWQARPRSCTARCQRTIVAWQPGGLRSSVPGAARWAARACADLDIAVGTGRQPLALGAWRSPRARPFAAPVLSAARSSSDRQRPGRVGQPGRGRDVELVPCRVITDVLGAPTNVRDVKVARSGDWLRMELYRDTVPLAAGERLSRDAAPRGRWCVTRPTAPTR